MSFALLAFARVDETEARSVSVQGGASGVGATSVTEDVRAMFGLLPSGLVAVFVLAAFLYVLILYKVVGCLVTGDVAAGYARCLPQLRAEHAFWMAGEAELPAGDAQAHLVRLPDGSLLNRYWDARCATRARSPTAICGPVRKAAGTSAAAGVPIRSAWTASRPRPSCRWT